MIRRIAAQLSSLLVLLTLSGCLPFSIHHTYVLTGPAERSSVLHGGQSDLRPRDDRPRPDGTVPAGQVIRRPRVGGSRDQGH